MVIALFGENDFMVKQRKQALISEYLENAGSEMGFEQFDSSVEPQKLWQSITSQPFLVEKKLVIVNNPSENTDLAEFMISKADEVPETTDVVIVEEKLDKRKSYYKNLKKMKNGEEFSLLDDRALLQWMIEIAKENKLELARPQAQKIINRVGNDQWRLNSEIVKLSVHGKITDEQLEQLVEMSPQDTIFNLLDSLASGNSKSAQELYENLRQQQLDPHYVMSMLAWQMENILLVAFAGNRQDREIASETKINPYVVQKTRGLTRRITIDKLKTAVKLLTKTDEQIKTSALDADDAVRLLLLRLAEAFA